MYDPVLSTFSVSCINKGINFREVVYREVEQITARKYASCVERTYSRYPIRHNLPIVIKLLRCVAVNYMMHSYMMRKVHGCADAVGTSGCGPYVSWH